MLEYFLQRYLVAVFFLDFMDRGQWKSFIDFVCDFALIMRKITDFNGCWIMYQVILWHALWVFKERVGFMHVLRYEGCLLVWSNKYSRLYFAMNLEKKLYRRTTNFFSTVSKLIEIIYLIIAGWSCGKWRTT